MINLQLTHKIDLNYHTLAINSVQPNPFPKLDLDQKKSKLTTIGLLQLELERLIRGSLERLASSAKTSKNS